MTEQILLLNYWLALGTLILEAGCLLLILLFLYLRFDRESALLTLQPLLNFSEKIWGSVEKNILAKIFILSFASSALTLYYSDVLGVVPCALCWFERVFMYGIVLISGTALFARNNLERIGIFRYLTVFSVAGSLVALYHHILQMTATATSHLPCPVSGGDCSKRIIFEFDHITFPWMAFIFFLSFILISLVIKEINRKD
jgi:disulfide bond formation protein DsbB